MAGQTQNSDGDIRRSAIANLLLFPLCDKRGWLTSALLGKPCHASIKHLYQSNADSIFFAWLLDLPAQIDASSAAAAILKVVADPTRTTSDFMLNEPDEGKYAFNRRLIHLLEKVVVDKSFYQAETLQSAIDQVVRESDQDE